MRSATTDVRSASLGQVGRGVVELEAPEAKASQGLPASSAKYATLHSVTVVLLCIALPLGCQPMSQQEHTDFDYPPAGTPSPSGVIPAHVPTDASGTVHIDTSKPIPFDRHKFGTACYSTYGCRVRYADRDMWPDLDDWDEVMQPASASVEGYPDVMGGGYDLRNFPLPAQVSWRDKNGTPHEATVDIAAIFKDQVVLHKVPQEQLPPILTAPIFPEIILEVNDRTIRVWMRADVPTKDLQIPGNIHSRFRDDMMLTYSKAY